ncbi:MAG: ribosome hibernation-promoting factor, HPF/YfiA family [Endomicrobiia bacterium]
MKIEIAARHVEVSKPLKEYAEKKISRLEKYLHKIENVKLKFEVEKYRHIAELKIHGDRNIFKAKEVSTDLYSSIDLVVDKIERQIQKFKEKIKSHCKSAMIKPRASLSNDLQKITSIEQFEIKPSAVSAAIDEMNSLNYNFYIFFNSKTGKLNVVYRKENNSYGLIELVY